MLFGIYRELKEFGQCIAASLCCFVCVGPLLAVVGVALIVSAGTDDRASTLSAYNNAVSSWTSGGYAGFRALTTVNPFQLRITSPANGQLVTTSQVLNNADPYSVDSGATTYSNQFRVWSGFSQSLDARPFAYPNTILSNPNFVSINTLQISNTLTGQVQSITVPTGWLTQTNPCTSSDSTSECNTKCANKGGTITNPTAFPVSSRNCARLFLLNEVCLVIANRTGADVLDSASGKGFGCAVVSSAAVGDTNGRMYTGPGNLGAFNFFSPAGAAYPSSYWPITITLRSAGDPYVTALRLTNGSPGSFGLTIAQKLSVGFALLGIGLGLFLIPACLITLLVRGLCGRKRGSQGSTQAYAAPAPPPAYAMPVQPYGAPQPMGYQASDVMKPPMQPYPPMQGGVYPPQPMGMPPMQGGGGYAPQPNPYAAYAPGANTPYQQQTTVYPGAYPGAYPGQAQGQYPPQTGGYASAPPSYQ